MADLTDWLARLGLRKYAPVLAQHEIDFDLLPRLTEADIRELGLPIGPRRKLLDAIAALRGEHAFQAVRLERRGEPERRQLTVMFVDLAKSTPLALRLDPEAMRDVLQAFQNAVTREIGRLGYVAKLMGDGVLAYFGWPRAHEDDAKRAVTAALAVVDAVGRLESPIGERLTCRIGIATGVVVVGDLIGEGAAQEHAVIGPTPNLAARLQETAGSGEVIIADTTRRLLGADFDIDALGERLLKGHNEPVPLFRVLRRNLHGRPSFACGSEDPRSIIGRESELAALRTAWKKAKSGNGQAVMVIGEAGIGKSRLVEALATEVIDAASVSLVFQCSPLHSDNPFWPIKQQLSTTAAIVERIAAQTQGSDRAQIRRDLVEAVTADCLATAHERPVALVFEDTQWADRATVELLRHLAYTIAAMPVLLIVTSRPEGEPRLDTSAKPIRLALPRLDNAAAAALLAIIAGSHNLTARLRGDILTRSDGIPLFIEEMTRAVIETAPGKTVSVPATLRDSLIARLDVSPAMKTVAQVASCIGRDFGQALLSSVADITSEELQQGLAALLQAGLVLASTTEQFRFKHALVRDIAYDSLLTPRRQRLHHLIAKALEAAPDGIAEREPETLARHWLAAGESRRAEIYWLRARHRVAHWQEQLDALADYLESDAGAVIPFPEAPGAGRLH